MRVCKPYFAHVNLLDLMIRFLKHKLTELFETFPLIDWPSIETLTEGF